MLGELLPLRPLLHMKNYLLMNYKFNLFFKFNIYLLIIYKFILMK